MSIPDADYAYEALLRFNYFPMVKFYRDEIPPVFSTEDLTVDVANKMIAAKSTLRRAGYDQIEYRSTRYNNVARQQHIPVPLPYVHLCQLFRDHWALLSYTYLNELSRVKPERHGKRLIEMLDYDEEVEYPDRLVVMERTQFPQDLVRVLDLSTNAKYLVEADVSNCFPSIYTHSIPWALVGHEYAKSHRGSGLWFNQIDAAQRSVKRGETHGIPIGPGTSNIVCEIVLAKVDEVLSSGGYKFQRFIDDYRCYVQTREEAEQFVLDLDRELDRYQLKLNVKKVRIQPLPMPTRQAWTNELTVAIDAGGEIGPSQIVKILDYSIHLGAEHPDGSVLKYAARILRSFLTKKNAAIYVRYLLNLAFHTPIVLPFIYEALGEFEIALDPNQLQSILHEHMIQRRSDGMCWTLLLLYVGGHQSVIDDCVDAVIKSQDCLAIAMLFGTAVGEAEAIRFVSRLKPTPPKYQFDQYWLLIHQAAMGDAKIRKKLSSYIEETGLKTLIDEGVSFMDFTKIPGAGREIADPM